MSHVGRPSHSFAALVASWFFFLPLLFLSCSDVSFGRTFSQNSYGSDFNDNFSAGKGIGGATFEAGGYASDNHHGVESDYMTLSHSSVERARMQQTQQQQQQRNHIEHGHSP